MVKVTSIQQTDESCEMFVLFLTAGAAIAGVYKAAGKTMISLEALVFGVGQSFCVLIISFLRILATL